ncbi:MAG: TolC family protein, partial [candidate division KSB1 bacterium]|nr:TolC family protein [candidate division KSB1 bacterium]
MRVIPMITAGLLLIGSVAAARPAEEATTSGQEQSVFSNGRVLPLNDAMQIALEKNLRLRAARKNVSAANWSVKNAYAQFLPTVNFNLNYLRLDTGTLGRANAFYDFVNDPTNAGFLPEELRRNVRPGAWRNAYGPSIFVTQPIFTGGALTANLNVAQAQEITAQANLSQALQQVIYDTQKAYFEVLKSQELLAVAKDNLQATEKHLNSARKQVEAGLRSKTEILRWEVQKANAESFLVRAENAVALARPALNHVLGLEMDTELTVVPVEEIDVRIPA